MRGQSRRHFTCSWVFLKSRPLFCRRLAMPRVPLAHCRRSPDLSVAVAMDAGYMNCRKRRSAISIKAEINGARIVFHGRINPAY